MEPVIIFGMSNIRKNFKVSREYVYAVADKYENSPFVKIEGRWCCVVEDFVEFIRNPKIRKGKV